MVFRETMVELVSGEGEVIPTNIVGCLITGDDPLLRVRRGAAGRYRRFVSGVDQS